VEISKGYGRPEVGGPFTLKDLDGKEFTEKDLLGKYTWIWSSSCLALTERVFEG
jgi:protein SCO1